MCASGLQATGVVCGNDRIDARQRVEKHAM
jgi:hypothetical protein